MDKDGKPILDEDGEKILSEFGEKLLEGKNIANAKVEHSLFESCFDRVLEDREELVELDKNGSPKPIRIRKTKKAVPANVMAQMYWLNNRCRKSGEWSQKQNVTIRDERDVDLSYLTEDELRRLAAMSPPETGDMR